MKLHHLRLRGIGPFRDEVQIDFTALGASGMFLLEGPTGSGKSTVLDAIVYALYGSVAGDGASGDRIRSQFADPRTQSLIDLIFETSHGLYRVLRTPEYFRLRKRRSVSGSDTLVKEQAKALLWRLGSPDLITEALEDTAGQGAGLTPIASRLDEVGREIARAVGLSRAQFTQTVLLPQNEFARFLRARTGERQGVLQRVFGTEIYEDIEKQLEQMRRDAAKQVDAATAALDRALAASSKPAPSRTNRCVPLSRVTPSTGASTSSPTASSRSATRPPLPPRRPPPARRPPAPARPRPAPRPIRPRSGCSASTAAVSSTSSPHGWPHRRRTPHPPAPAWTATVSPSPSPARSPAAARPAASRPTGRRLASPSSRGTASPTRSWSSSPKVPNRSRTWPTRSRRRPPGPAP